LNRHAAARRPTAPIPCGSAVPLQALGRAGAAARDPRRGRFALLGDQILDKVGGCIVGSLIVRQVVHPAWTRPPRLDET
jgi:hypothetical protein